MTRYIVTVDETPSGGTPAEWALAVPATNPDHPDVITLVAAGRNAAPRIAEHLERTADTLRRHHPHVAVETESVAGATLRQLLSHSGEGDVLVIAAHHRNWLNALLSDRGAEQAITYAVIPVVVVPSDWRSSNGPVLLGVDSLTAGSALSFAGAEAARRGTELVLVRAWQLPIATSPWGDAYLIESPATWQEIADVELGAAVRCARSARPDLAIRGERRAGLPAVVLHQIHPNPSLVIVGRRHRTVLGGLLFGSVGEELVRSASAPVCVVPPSTTVTADVVDELSLSAS